MRRPATPPDITSMLAGDPPDAIAKRLEKLRRHDVLEFVRKVNDKYLHWHKLRYYPLPDDVTSVEAWAAVQFSRFTQLVSLPVSFQSGRLSFWSPPQHVEWLHRIDQQAGGMIGSTSRYAIPDDRSERYLFNSLMEEAIASSQLEGAATTRRIAKDMLRAKRRPRSRAERMIINNYNAILEIRDSKDDDLTPEMLCHLHGVLTKGTLDDESAAGRFRTSKDDVVVVDAYSDEILHTPPSAAGLESRIGEICNFANAKPDPFVHPVIQAIVLHFALGYVHPFTDGNGRTARAVFYWLMLKRGYWLFEYLPISRIFLDAPAKYGRAYLYTETDGGDVTYFIHYHLQVILRAIKELHQYLHRQQKKMDEAVVILNSCPAINQRQASLLYYLIRHPDSTHTIRSYQGANQIGYATARADLLDLESRGFLEKTLRGKTFSFRPVRELLRTLDAKLNKLVQDDARDIGDDELDESDEVGNIDDMDDLPLFKILKKP